MTHFISHRYLTLGLVFLDARDPAFSLLLIVQQEHVLLQEQCFAKHGLTFYTSLLPPTYTHTHTLPHPLPHSGLHPAPISLSFLMEGPKTFPILLYTHPSVPSPFLFFQHTFLQVQTHSRGGQKKDTLTPPPSSSSNTPSSRSKHPQGEATRRTPSPHTLPLLPTHLPLGPNTLKGRPPEGHPHHTPFLLPQRTFPPGPNTLRGRLGEATQKDTCWSSSFFLSFSTLPPRAGPSVKAFLFCKSIT